MFIYQWSVIKNKYLNSTSYSWSHAWIQVCLIGQLFLQVYKVYFISMMPQLVLQTMYHRNRRNKITCSTHDDLYTKQNGIFWNEKHKVVVWTNQRKWLSNQQVKLQKQLVIWTPGIYYHRKIHFYYVHNWKYKCISHCTYLYSYLQVVK